jgi:hypothetical protein
MWSELALFMWSDFVLMWSEVLVKFLETKVLRTSTLGWLYNEGTWLYCYYFIWCVSGTVVVLTCSVMCGWVYVGVLWQLCRCIGDMCTCICCILYCLYCVLVLFRLCIFILIYFVCTTVRATATEWKLKCSSNSSSSSSSKVKFFHYRPRCPRGWVQV